MGIKDNYDFCGWATVNDLKCGDGRTIRKDAFKDDDGKTVPIVWMHQHNSIDNVLGHGLLENRDKGVFFYGKLNNSPAGQNAREAINNGDITQLSINANNLTQQGGNVLHGVIREVSLVLAGANPGANIMYPIIEHSDGSTYELDDEATITTGEAIMIPEPKEELNHTNEDDMTIEDVLGTYTEEQYDVAELLIHAAVEGVNPDEIDGELQHADSGATVKDILGTFNETQLKVLYYLIAKAMEGAKSSAAPKDTSGEKVEHSYEGGNSMTHNIFENDNKVEITLSHADTQAIFENAKRSGSLKMAVEAYADSINHSITDIEEYLFPVEKEYNSGAPEFVRRDDAWVTIVWNKVHKTPFSRVKTTFADITADAARAKGYIKGHQKLEEVFGLLKRVTTPQTVYKLQKLDRDDIIDITDFDVVVWIKGEMRIMLNEEIARAILIGDGRNPGVEDKINEENIRPIWSDDDFYAIHKDIELADDASNYDKAEAMIEAALRARKDYKGSGTPDAFFEPDIVTTMLLAKDKNGRRIYSSVSDLASALRVKNIYEVPVFEDQIREDKQHNYHKLLGIIVNLSDYSLGADKGGAVNTFDDFDIDYNRYTYLIETRCSGALIRPYSAIVLEQPVDAPEDDEDPLNP